MAENSEGADKTELFADSQQKECRPNTDIPKAVFVLNVSDWERRNTKQTKL